MNFVPDKRPNVALVGRLEELVVLEPVLLADDDWRVARLHQDEVHEQPGFFLNILCLFHTTGQRNKGIILDKF